MSQQSGNQKIKTAAVVEIGLIGAALTFVLDAGFNLTDPEQIKLAHGCIPVVSAFLFKIWLWVSALLTPLSAEIILARRAMKKAIKECDDALNDPNCSDQLRTKIQTRKDFLVEARVDKLTTGIFSKKKPPL